MKKLILASKSPQRRALMKILGLPFVVRVPRHVKESADVSKGCGPLVQANALFKAQAVAQRTPGGIVIGADTIVYSGRGQLILKPKNFQEAKRNLKELMARPHWVYSGLALIEMPSGRCQLGWEKTRVFMRKLSDDAIRRYHRRMGPLDKAGGFDIEGKGAFFIPRIEGCYFNVVGLPLAKLALMLEKFGVRVL